jgi:hypothetical protein
MGADEFVERENDIIRILEAFSKSRIDYVLVGGYAVTAFGKHRYSTDCDLVVRSLDVDRFQSVLKAEKFSKGAQLEGFDSLYGGRFIRYVKSITDLPVSVDLLVDSLTCRDTGGSWSFEYVFLHSESANVVGIQRSTDCRVVNKELLIAFKLHSARMTDVRDVISLADQAKWDEVISHLKRGDSQKLKARVKKFLQHLDDEKLVNSFKGVFSLRGDVKREIEQTRKHLQGILGQLETGSQNETSGKAPSRKTLADSK